MGILQTTMETGARKTDSDGQKPVLLAIAVLGILSFLMRDAVVQMFLGWQKDEYSHGYVVPLVALILMLSRMEDTGYKPRSSWMGLVIVLAAVCAGAVLRAAGVYGILPMFYLIAVVGVLVLFLGSASLRVFAGPYVLLMFAAPLPKFFYYTLSVRMQAISTTLGTLMLDALGIPVFQDGNIIDLGGYKLEVAEACNGLRYLFPLVALSFLIACMYRASFIKRALVFVSALPVAALMNGLRIAFIGVTVSHWGTGMAEGLLHDIEGWMVFVGCTVCLLAEVWLLNRIGGKSEFDVSALRLPAFARIRPFAGGAPALAAAVTLLLCAVAGQWGPRLLPVISPVPLAKPFTVFPLELGGWIGRTDRLDAAALAKLGTRDYLLADYEKPGVPPVNVYTLYFPEQDSTSNEAVHSPAVCMPSGGWAIENNSVKTINLGGGHTVPVNRVLVAKDRSRQAVFYWFVQNGQVTASANAARLYQITNAFAHGHTNGAMVRLATPIVAGESQEHAEQRLGEFMSMNMNVLNRFMFGNSAP